MSLKVPRSIYFDSQSTCVILIICFYFVEGRPTKFQWEAGAQAFVLVGEAKKKVKIIGLQGTGSERTAKVDYEDNTLGHLPILLPISRLYVKHHFYNDSDGKFSPTNLMSSIVHCI